VTNHVLTCETVRKAALGALPCWQFEAAHGIVSPAQARLRNPGHQKVGEDYKPSRRKLTISCRRGAGITQIEATRRCRATTKAARGDEYKRTAWCSVERCSAASADRHLPGIGNGEVKLDGASLGAISAAH